MIDYYNVGDVFYNAIWETESHFVEITYVDEENDQYVFVDEYGSTEVLGRYFFEFEFCLDEKETRRRKLNKILDGKV